MMRRGRLAIVAMALVFAVRASAQPATQPSIDAPLDFGTAGLVFPPAVIVNGHSPRTAQLLGEAYRRGDPLVWKRVQLVAELGEVALPDAVPFLIEAMKDASPAVRSEAARAAAKVGDPTLTPAVTKLLDDQDPTVRREGVLALGALSNLTKPPRGAATSVAVSPNDLITHRFDDVDVSVLAAAIQVASSAQHAQQIAARLPSFPGELRADAALAMARLNATDQSAAILPLLHGDVLQRTAALRALSALADRSRAPDVLNLLTDPHPTVRREAIAATGKLANPATREAKALALLADPDFTVRQAAAEVLTPVPSPQALSALAGQLILDDAPLHETIRTALAHPASPELRDATIRLAAAMLADANADPRRREDASFVLGQLGSDAAIEQHLVLLKWDATTVAARTDWQLVAQAAESLGLIGDARAAAPLMTLVEKSPEAMDAVPRPRAEREQMARAMANAVVAAARLHHRAALPEAARILQIDPAQCPRSLRTAAAFAIGVLGETGGRAQEAGKLLEIYDSVYEDSPTKLEALKALGNLRHTPAAEKLARIAELEPAPDLRWMAHWSLERCTNQRVPYTPPTLRHEPPVSISDLTPR